MSFRKDSCNALTPDSCKKELQVDPVDIKKIYEMNVDTNGYTDAEKEAVAKLLVSIDGNSIISDKAIKDAYERNRDTNSLTDREKELLGKYINGGAVPKDTYTDKQVDAKLAAKIDAVNGKGLSTLDFTTLDKNKLDNIPAGGKPGIQGLKGNTGNVGPVGPAGPKGNQGDRGFHGTNGSDGKDGAVGATGAKGDPGIQGPTGAQGPQGVKGDKGTNGADSTVAGPKGIQGVQGLRGLQGNQGLRGNNGLDGKDGTGVTIKGSDSKATILGKSGTAGDMWLITDPGAEFGHGLVSDGGGSGIAHWTNVGAIRGPRGLKGDDGARGPTGAASTVVGPKGATGPAGIQGPTGAKGVDGKDSVVPGPKGSQGPTGPQGVQGLKGDKGEKGDPGTGGGSGGITPGDQTKLDHITVTKDIDLDNLPTGGTNDPAMKFNVDTVGDIPNVPYTEGDMGQIRNYNNTGKEAIALYNDNSNWSFFEQTPGMTIVKGDPHATDFKKDDWIRFDLPAANAVDQDLGNDPTEMAQDHRYITVANAMMIELALKDYVDEHFIDAVGSRQMVDAYTPSKDGDVVTKKFADANYKGGGSTPTGVLMADGSVKATDHLTIGDRSSLAELVLDSKAKTASHTVFSREGVTKSSIGVIAADNDQLMIEQRADDDIRFILPVGNNIVAKIGTEFHTLAMLDDVSASGGLFQYDYKIKTDASDPTPAVKHISFDDVDFTKTTKVYINKKDRLGTDMSLFLKSIGKGDWFNIHDNGDINDFVAFDVTGPSVQNGDIFEIPVSHYDGNGTFKNDERVYVHWQQPAANPFESTHISAISDITRGGIFTGDNLADAPVQGKVNITATQDADGNIGLTLKDSTLRVYEGGIPHGGTVHWKHVAPDHLFGHTVPDDANGHDGDIYFRLK